MILGSFKLSLLPFASKDTVLNVTPVKVGKVAGGALSGPPSACASCPNGLPTLKLLF